MTKKKSFNCVQNLYTEVLIQRLKMRKNLGFPHNWNTGVFEVADYDLAIILLILKMADLIWWLKIRKSLGFSHNWNTGVFKVADHQLAISLQKFKMAIKSSRESQILFKTCIQGFPRSTIKILLLYLRNSKWLIQHGGEKLKKTLIYLAQNWYT